MVPSRTAQALMLQIQRYRRTRLARATGGCCRFSPSCSHYADEALLTRRLPVAVVLILWRLARCRGSVVRGTLDAVPAPWSRRRMVLRGSAMAMLVGITGLLTAGVAIAGSGGRPALTRGGCDAQVSGAPIGSYDRDHPLDVTKGDTVSVSGSAPAAFAATTTHIATTLRFEILGSFGLYVSTRHDDGSSWTGSANVDDYLKRGSGLYRVNVTSQGTQGGTATLWHCEATFYVKLSGSKLGADIALVAALAGGVGVVTSPGRSGWGADDVPPLPDGDPGPLTGVERDRSADLRDTAAGLGCVGAAIMALLVNDDPFGGLYGMAVPLVGTRGPSFRRRGHIIRGAIGGLFLGLGLTVGLQQYGVWLLTWSTAVGLPVLAMVVGGLRGWRGTHFRAVYAGTAPTEEPPG